LKETLDEWTT